VSVHGTSTETAVASAIRMRRATGTPTSMRAVGTPGESPDAN
jgi:hypothetical protein